MRRVALALAASLAIAMPAMAEETPSYQNTEFLYVFSQELPQLLQNVAERNGMRAVISSSVRGRVKDLRLPVRLSLMLERLSQNFDIEWYIEADTLNISRKSEAVSKVIDLKQVSFRNFERQLQENGIDTRRIGLRKIGKGGVVSFTATPVLAARLEQLANSLASSETGTIILYRYGVPAPMRVAKP